VPEEIPVHLPHVTLAQDFDALSYYSDHQEEINAHIERNREGCASYAPVPPMTGKYFIAGNRQ
jgi:hypothetical protein